MCVGGLIVNCIVDASIKNDHAQRYCCVWLFDSLVKKHETIVECFLLSVISCCFCFYERSVDALASGADEGRGGLRYASGSRLTGCDPRISEWGDPARVNVVSPAPEYIGCVEVTRGSETSQYPQEKIFRE